MLIVRSGGSSSPNSFLVDSRTLNAFGNLDILIVFHNPSMALDIPSSL